jgi:hypothetical protein
VLLSLPGTGRDKPVQAKNASGRVELQLHSLLNWTLDGGECPPALLSRLAQVNDPVGWALKQVRMFYKWE